jgi:hypothetical protein
MSASDVIARLRELHERWMMFDRSMIPVEAEMAKAFPALLECAEAVQKIHDHLSDYIDARKTVDVSVAVAFETSRAALQALSKTTGETNA